MTASGRELWVSKGVGVVANRNNITMECVMLFALAPSRNLYLHIRSYHLLPYLIQVSWGNFSHRKQVKMYARPCWKPTVTLSVTWPFDWARAISYRCSIGTDTLSPRDFEILRLKCIWVTVFTSLGHVMLSVTWPFDWARDTVIAFSVCIQKRAFDRDSYAACLVWLSDGSRQATSDTVEPVSYTHLTLPTKRIV